MKTSNLIFFISILVLTSFGLVILFASSSFISQQEYSDPYYYIKKQGISTFIGLLLLFFMSQIRYQIWYKAAWPLYILSILLLCLVFNPLVGKEAGGASRWITIFNISYQPSDLARFSTILLLSNLYTDDKMNIFYKTSLAILVISLPVLLISLEPDFGTAFHLIIASTFFLLFTNFPKTILLILSVSSAPIIYYSVIKVSWRLKRFKAFLDPWKYRFEEGYQLIASFKSFLAGNIWGEGLGGSHLRHHLQARHIDFVLAVIAEELGFVGICFTLMLYLFIIFHGMILLKKLDDPFARLFGSGMIIIFSTQAIIHIGVNIGLLPTTGINLPIVSYGGTSMITYLMMFGIFLSLFKEQNVPPPKINL